MTTPSRMALLMATGIGALYALFRAERVFSIYAHTGWVGPWQRPSFSECIFFGALAAILTLIFLVLGMNIVYRCYIRKP